MGKYTKFKEELPRFRPDQGWQGAVDLEKQPFRGQSMVDLLGHLRAAKDAKDLLEDAVKPINTRIEALSQLLVEVFETDELTSVKLQDGGSAFLADDPYVSLDGDVEVTWKDKDTIVIGTREYGRELVEILPYLDGIKKKTFPGRQLAYDYLRATQPEIFTVNAKTMEAIGKAALLSGENLPPGLKLFMKVAVKIKRGKTDGSTQE